MKKISKVMVVFFSMCLLISGCGSGDTTKTIESDNDQQSYWNDAPYEYAKGDSGYYFIAGIDELGEDKSIVNVRKMYYFDGNTKEVYPVCGKAQCKHTDETCDAYISGDYLSQGIRFYQGHIYLLKYDSVSCDVTLVRFSKDCTERKEMCVMTRSSLATGGKYGLIFHDNFLYFYDITGYETLNESNHIAITKLALDGSTREEIFTDDSGNSSIASGKSYGDNLMFTVTSRKKNGDKIEANTSGIYAYDYNTGEITIFLDEPVSGFAIDTKNQILYYYKFNEGLFRKDLSNNKTEKIYSCEDESKFCQISFDGNNVYMCNSRMQTIGFLGVPVYIWAIDSNGQILNKVTASNAYFGDDKYMFCSKWNNDRIDAVYSKDNIEGWTDDNYIDITIK